MASCVLLCQGTKCRVGGVSGTLSIPHKLLTFLPGQELVYVPLQMFPFTRARVARWRDILGPRLRKPQLRWVVDYLDDRAPLLA